jgi:hypothetical protein
MAEHDMGSVERVVVQRMKGSITTDGKFWVIPVLLTRTVFGNGVRAYVVYEFTDQPTAVLYRDGKSFNAAPNIFTVQYLSRV